MPGPHVSVQSPAIKSVTLIVAAADSKFAYADYVCDGTADESEINTAIGALPT
jgi:hypothetical protein